MISCIARKSAGGLGALFFVFLLSSTGNAADDLQSADVAAEFGFSMTRFRYAEFNDTGSVLDTEQGVIPGLSFRLAQRPLAWGRSWEWEGLAGYHYGRVDYTGQTQSGVPYNTRTGEEISDYALRIGSWFEGSYPVMPYAGLGYRRWDRDILPASLGGLFESYRWKYAWLGTKIVAYQRDASNLTLDIGWIKPVDPVLHVDFRGAYNVSPRLNPGSRDGLRLMLTSRSALPENATLILEPYFEYWKLGRSPSLTTGGITVHEPASRTNNFGFNLRLGKMY
ncbi:MAG: hypothetical protein NUV63_00905 [Gallionella sp.]|nr:hypothetical protein [Gallionella sp.]